MPALGAETTKGPIPAYTLRVVDGDTIKVRARIWLGQTMTTAIRVDGVDTPEIQGKCEAEKSAAQVALAFVERLPREVTLRNVRHGKYARRVVAKVWVDGKNLARLLISEELGRAYDGGKRGGWC